MLGNRLAAGLASLVVFAIGGCSDDSRGRRPPNILLVIMDDVGMDQMQAFGHGGLTPARTPNINALATAGIRFGNVWAMPACTTSRAVLFGGRFPVRTQVSGALGPDDLANSQVSPYEMTAPKLLARRGYESGFFGKFHLGLQGLNPAGLAMPHALGWSYFAGWLDASGDHLLSTRRRAASRPRAPGRVASCRQRQTAGLTRERATWPVADAPRWKAVGRSPPGRSCRDSGGIFDPGKICQLPAPAYLNFSTLSGHYVSPLVINHEDGSVERVPPTDSRARQYRATEVVDAAIDWIGKRPADVPGWRRSVLHRPIRP